MVRILVADHNPIIRRGMKQILAETTDMMVKDEATNGLEALDKVRQSDFDVVLLDLSIPGISGMDVLKQIRTEKPTLPVLVLSRYPEEQCALPAIKAGASGYLAKTGIANELVNAIRKVSSGGQYVSLALAEGLVGELTKKGRAVSQPDLSDWEREVISLLASGKKISEIAEALRLSPTTVSRYRSRIMKKMRFRSDSDLVRDAIENDLID